ncbi:MAG: hypothetical protein ACLSAP_04935 [Oscillospiraceae bacterium]
MLERADANEKRRLLDCLEQDFRKEPAPATAGACAGRQKGQKTPHQVDGVGDKDQRQRRYSACAGAMRTISCKLRAQEANKELMEQDRPAQLNINQIVDTIEDIDEDIDAISTKRTPF